MNHEEYSITVSRRCSFSIFLYYFLKLKNRREIEAETRCRYGSCDIMQKEIVMASKVHFRGNSFGEIGPAKSCFQKVFLNLRQST